MLTSGQVLTGLEIAVLIMVMVLLYHALFIAVDLRKVLRRFDDITKQVEDVLLKPISMVDHILEWTIDMIEDAQKKGKKEKKGKKGKKKRGK